MENNNECQLCGGTGWIEWKEQHFGLTYDYAKECICVQRRRQMRLMQASNLPDTERMRLGTFSTSEEWQKRIADTAYRFAGWTPESSDDIPPWFFIGGQAGSGKTHICTGICCNLIRNSQRTVQFSLWDELVQKLKDKSYGSDANELMQKTQNVDVLYLDDFLHGSAGRSSVNLAYEIINARYNNRKQTIISSEHFLQEIIDMDHGLGGRIHERTRGFRLSVMRAADHDYRIRRTRNG